MPENKIIVYVSLQFLSELNNIFHVKDLKLYTFHIKLIDTGNINLARNYSMFSIGVVRVGIGTMFSYGYKKVFLIEA